MQKKTPIIAVILFILVLFLIPIRTKYEDGGSIGYRAALYEIIKLHELGGNDETNPYIEGIEIKILGMTVYRNTNE